MMTPSKRTLDRLAKDGWYACVVERYIQQIHRRKDAFGFGDILAMHPYHGIMLVQATTNAHAMNRADKILDSFLAVQWLRSGGRIEIWGWRKLKVPTKKGGTRYRWKARRLEVSLADTTETPSGKPVSKLTDLPDR